MATAASQRLKIQQKVNSISRCFLCSYQLSAMSHLLFSFDGPRWGLLWQPILHGAADTHVLIRQIAPRCAGFSGARCKHCTCLCLLNGHLPSSNLVYPFNVTYMGYTLKKKVKNNQSICMATHKLAWTRVPQHPEYYRTGGLVSGNAWLGVPQWAPQPGRDEMRFQPADGIRGCLDGGAWAWHGHRRARTARGLFVCISYIVLAPGTADLCLGYLFSL